FLAEKIGADGAITATASDNVITIEAKVAGVPFTISGAHVDNGSNPDETITIATPQANVAAVAETRATATLTVTGGVDGSVTSVLLGSTELLSKNVQWKATNAATAERIAQAINSTTSTSDYTAAVVDNVLT